MITKKVIAILLAVMMLLAMFAGCSNDAKTDDSSSSSSSSSSASSDKKEDTKTEDKKEEEKKEEEKKDETPAADSNFNETGLPIVNEPVSFTIWANTDIANLDELAIHEMIAEETNIYPEWIAISPAAIDERKALMWASNDYPDVLGPSTVNVNDTRTYGPMGILQPLDELFEKYAVNFNQYADDATRVNMKASDGKMYFIPYLCENSTWDCGYNINQKWLDNLGLAMPTNLDEFTEVLRAIKAGDPNGNGDTTDEIPFVISKYGGLPATLAVFAGNFGMPGGYQVVDGTVVNGYLEDSFKESLIYLRDIYQEGLLDPEMFTMDTATLNARGKTPGSLYGVILGYTPPYHTGENQKEYETMPLLKDENGNTTPFWLRKAFAEVDFGPQLAITVNCECPEVVMRWADFMMTPNISIQIDQGIQGIRLDENYSKYGDDKIPAGFATWNDWVAANRLQQLPRVMTPQAFADYNLPWEKGDQYWREQRDEAYRPYDVVSVPNIAPIDDETEIETLYKADVDKYFEETVASWISNNGDIDAEWDTFLANMAAFGEGELRAVKQAQYDRSLTLLG